MARNLICLGLFAAFAALAAGWSAAPSANPKPAPKRPAEKAAVPAKKVSLAEKLRKEVAFPGVDDPKATLQDVLEQLTKLCDVTFDVNERAFKYEMLNDVLKSEVANPNAIPPMKRSLDAVLRRVLARVTVPSGATYMIRRDAIEITTHQFTNTEITFPVDPPNPLDDEKADSGIGKIVVTTFPLVTIDYRKKPLAEALETLADDTDINIIFGASAEDEKAKIPVTLKVRNLPADTAVLMLAAMADLEMVQLDNALFVTTRTKAVALKKAHAQRRLKKFVEDPLDEQLRKEEERTDRLGKKAAKEQR